MESLLYSLIEAIWLILPAYAANSFATLPRGHRRMDFGKTMSGKPLLGSGKTWEGFFFGIFVAVIIALIQQWAFPYLPWDASPVPLNIVPMSLTVGLLLGLGTMLGDTGGSFIKRRIGLKRGRAAPGIDQLDFIVGSLIAVSILVSIQWEWISILVILTPVVHLIANLGGYVLKVKKEPY